VSIYSQPPQFPGEPENAMRARNGERPMCWNRPDYPATQTVNDGWTWDGMLQLASVRTPMSKGCMSWAVRAPDPHQPGDTGEDPGTEAIPARERWLCLDCQHLPSDPRVVAAAQRNAERAAAPKFNPWAGLSMIAKAADRSDGGSQ
jgi:hypothetical protein